MLIQCVWLMTFLILMIYPSVISMMMTMLLKSRLTLQRNQRHVFGMRKSSNSSSNIALSLCILSMKVMKKMQKILNQVKGIFLYVLLQYNYWEKKIIRLEVNSLSILILSTKKIMNFWTGAHYLCVSHHSKN